MNKLAIQLDKVSKKYLLHHQKPTLTESLLKRREVFWALKNINLEVKKGQRLGIIGPNGSGKSTLLKIIAGISPPTIGKVKAWGKIASLISLDSGFHPDLTGEENVLINGLLLGMDKQTIKKNFGKIIKFSGIKKFIDAPLHTYSSGMKLRLGFSVAVHSNPDILIIDEVVTAGDQKFRQKSFAKIQEFFRQKKTILFVSHNLRLILKLCPKTLWLEKGKIKALGPSKKIITQYLKNQPEKTSL
jgi:ABC-2 type transport system ATP-binding protein/lipopolysaccharide transport system ATP-binding protein